MKRAAVILTLFTFLLPVGIALAQTVGDYNLSWSTIDGGGGESSGGSYTLVGTIGQPDARSAMSGGSYDLFGGLWSLGSLASAPGSDSMVYLPLVVR